MDVKIEQVSGLSVPTFDIDRARIAHCGLNVSDVQEVVSIAFGGQEAGTLHRGDQRFPIIVNCPRTSETGWIWSARSQSCRP